VRAVASSGLRKNWSNAFSASDRVARNSPTTVPMVCRSLTRRYNSSIHASSGSALFSATDLLETFSQAIGALRQFALILVSVGQRGLQIEHGRGHFESHFRCWRLA
jgi:hypothetical protein